MNSIPFPPAEWWKKNGLPVPLQEYRFHSSRKWRFDYYFFGFMVAIEIEGGVFKYGRHNRAVGFLKDMEKYNMAAEFGIRVLRYPSISKIDVRQVRRAIEVNHGK